MDPDDKSWLRQKVEEAFFAAVQAMLNADRATERVEALRRKHPGMPKDALAKILTDRAARKTMIEGGVNGGAITAAESVAVAPVPEPSSKTLALSSIGALIAADIGFTTKIQMQLVFEMGEIYECPFSKDDEDDVWLIFKAAMGAKGTERVGTYARFVFNETATKQFRGLLRKYGIRRTAQKVLEKVAGKEVAKRLSERSVLRLIWGANIFLGALFNLWVTKGVGKWAKVKAKVRASVFSDIDSLKAIDKPSAVLVLPLLFWIGTADDRLVDNTITLYAQAARRLALDREELKQVDDLIDRENLAEILEERLRAVPTSARQSLLNIAVTSAASARLRIVDAHHQALIQIAGVLERSYGRKDLEEKIAYLMR